MATFSSILSPTPLQGNHVAALAATTASAEQAASHNQLISIFATGVITIRLGTAGAVGAPTASTGGFDFSIPANSLVVFDMGRAYDSFKVFNTTAAAIDIFWAAMSRN
jgi:hypothetical protein